MLLVTINASWATQANASGPHIGGYLDLPEKTTEDQYSHSTISLLKTISLCSPSCLQTHDPSSSASQGAGISGKHHQTLGLHWPLGISSSPNRERRHGEGGKQWRVTRATSGKEGQAWEERWRGQNVTMRLRLGCGKNAPWSGFWMSHKGRKMVKFKDRIWWEIFNSLASGAFQGN